MSKETVGEFVIRRLHEQWGVRRVFGYPGDGINGLLGAFHTHGDDVAFVQARHEEIAAFMACGHAKWTQEPGVCLATSGPGAIHLLNGLYDAKLDHAPVVAIVGQQKTISLGGHYQQEVDLQALFKDVASEYLQTIMTPAQAPHVIDRAFRIAKATRSVTCVIIPADVQEEPVEEPPRTHGVVYSGGGIPTPRVVPSEPDLHRAADILNAGERVAVLVGQGARGAEEELIELADRLGCGIARALNGREILGDELPFVTGAIGLLGTTATHEMISGCDTLLMIGTSFPYSEWLPEPGQARGVQIDLDGRMLGIRYPNELNLVGDSADTLRALLPLLERKADRAWREKIEAGVAAWWRTAEAQAMTDAEPVNPQRVLWELSARLPDGAFVTADSGSAAFWWARHLRLRRGMRAALSGTLATMCPAIPYALAAKHAHRDRPAVAISGDGAMQMLGLNALIDVARTWEEWADPRLVVAVLNNRDLNMVTWEQRVLAGDARLDASQLLPDVDYAGFARSLGLEGIRVERPEDIGSAWDACLSAGRPALLDVVVDPEVPPLPPEIQAEQAKGFAQSLLARDPAAGRMIKQVVKQKAQEFRDG